MVMWRRSEGPPVRALLKSGQVPESPCQACDRDDPPGNTRTLLRSLITPTSIPNLKSKI